MPFEPDKSEKRLIQLFGQVGLTVSYIFNPDGSQHQHDQVELSAIAAGQDLCKLLRELDK